MICATVDWLEYYRLVQTSVVKSNWQEEQLFSLICQAVIAPFYFQNVMRQHVARYPGVHQPECRQQVSFKGVRKMEGHETREGQSSIAAITIRDAVMEGDSLCSTQFFQL